ncbi:superinfection immunity protein [Paraburkholderia sp. BL10I2N1]|uniref:superinfection immunity protein n=1 Tax=Paraburkholderia sp. BL10I2N1 TaxID=1938796 RepID=UPI0010601489|nr:superinfection immunity protein [Paraburkholderia sp. BL10I2N1]TDN64054.1 T4 superinfection immunity protein [Paraburkholderia sp. BL10I2N1]
MGGNIVVQVIAAGLALALYFLPSILADRRKRHDLLVIALFNACLGWTVFGWLLALFWALQPDPPGNVAGEVVANRRNVVLRVFSTQLAARVRARATRNAAREESERPRK